MTTSLRPLPLLVAALALPAAAAPAASAKYKECDDGPEWIPVACVGLVALSCAPPLALIAG
jgi:hypothetical protein